MQTWFINGRHMSRAEMLKWKEKRDKELKKEAPLKEAQEVDENPTASDAQDPVELEKDDLAIDLELTSKKYEEKTGQPVPNRYKNDLEWIKSKLTSE